MHSAAYLGRLVGKGLFKLSQQIIGRIEPSYLMTRAGQYQSLRALSAPHIQNTLSRLQDVSQLRRDELLTDDVPQLTESVDPAFFGALRSSHTDTYQARRTRAVGGAKDRRDQGLAFTRMSSEIEVELGGLTIDTSPVVSRDWAPLGRDDRTGRRIAGSRKL
jgi:hypothetical protein